MPAAGEVGFSNVAVSLTVLGSNIVISIVVQEGKQEDEE